MGLFICVPLVKAHSESEIIITILSVTHNNFKLLELVMYIVFVISLTWQIKNIYFVVSCGFQTKHSELHPSFERNCLCVNSEFVFSVQKQCSASKTMLNNHNGVTLLNKYLFIAPETQPDMFLRTFFSPCFYIQLLVFAIETKSAS